MGTFIWLCITTGIGYCIGYWSEPYSWHDYSIDATVVDGVIGFVVGLLLRMGDSSGIADGISSFSDGSDYGD